MTDDAQRAKRAIELGRILADAHRLSAKGSGAMYAEDEARMLAQETLDLLIRYMEIDHAG